MLNSIPFTNIFFSFFSGSSLFFYFILFYFSKRRKEVVSVENAGAVYSLQDGSHRDFLVTFVLSYKRWRTWERVVLLVQQQSWWGNSICIRYLLCVKISYGHCSPPRGQTVPVECYALPTPISVLFWVSVRTELNQKLVAVWSFFCPRSMGVEAVLHLKIFFVSRTEIK